MMTRKEIARLLKLKRKGNDLVMFPFSGDVMTKREAMEDYEIMSKKFYWEYEEFWMGVVEVKWDYKNHDWINAYETEV